MTRQSIHWLILAFTFLTLTGPAPAQEQPSEPAAQQRFHEHLQALTQTPHRLAGSPEGRQAGDYIARQLTEMGLQVQPLNVHAWTQQVVRGEIEIDGQSAPLLPMRPNVTVWPTTPDQGLTGPLIYVGRGELADYGDRSAEDAIVAMDYESDSNWRLAFTMGAKAVLFLHEDEATSRRPHHLAAPANLVRLYAGPEAVERLNLREDKPQVTVHSQVRWNQAYGRNLIAMIPGTDPAFAQGRVEPELLVLAANYDTYGQVPHLSQGARGAANVAALLQAAEQLKANPPKRDVLLVFLDNQAHFHQGARDLYRILTMKDEQHETLRSEHLAERKFWQVTEQFLHNEDLSASETADEARAALMLKFFTQAELIRGELNQERLASRREKVDIEMAMEDAEAEGVPSDPAFPKRLEALAQLDEELTERISYWDDVRRLLRDSSVRNGQGPMITALLDEAEAWVQLQAKEAESPEALEEAPTRLAEITTRYQELREQIESQVTTRLAELEDEIELDMQRLKVRQMVGDRFIVAHLTYNLGDATDSWSMVVGDSLQEVFPSNASDVDAPGFYGRFLSGVRSVVKQMPEANRPAPAPLDDPTLATQYVPGEFTTGGVIAGWHGIYNLSYMTGHDGRLREGHPSDTLANLDWQQVQRLSAEANNLTARLADAASISLNREFSDVSTNSVSGWDNTRASGMFAGLQLSGGLNEDRPARGGAIALWAAPGGRWSALDSQDKIPGFSPMILDAINANGHYEIWGIRSHLFGQYGALGTIFDEAGRVAAITNNESLWRWWDKSTRVTMFPANPYVVASTVVPATVNQPLKILRAGGNAPFRMTSALTGDVEGVGFFYVHRFSTSDAAKLFSPTGQVFLNITDESEFGTGLPIEAFEFTPPVSLQTAKDRWKLNDHRLSKLRNRVSQPDLERLHGRSSRLMDQAAETPGTAEREAALVQSDALSQRVYGPLRSAMDDLVHAVVVLLLLAIPFAFALERLIICATSVYARMGGFTLMFMITFLALYMMHPGFAIATTPIIILLAFAIMLLSSMVIYILVRKFQTELHAMQGQGNAAHQIQSSAMATLLAAVGMGMSTMRRRPTRTILTAVTVIMLTFTILCFASLSSHVGVKSIYEGPSAGDADAGMLIRQLSYQPLSDTLPQVLWEAEGEGGLLAEQWWLVREKPGDPRLSVATLDGRSMMLDAVMGVMPEEVGRWEDLSTAISNEGTQQVQQKLSNKGVYLPPLIAEQLELEPGQTILVFGKPAVFAGSHRPQELAKLRHLDGRPMLPVDFATVTTKDDGGGEEAAMDLEATQREFKRLGPNQVAVASSSLTRDAGGKLYAMTIYPGVEVDPVAAGKLIAEKILPPVWARGAQGVDRLIFGRITEVSGGMALVVPVLLGGLIIFGTLLGSISDREREIYTFSALGLSPTHVGFLFFAEAAVYAVVGGLGGQLLAQAVALVAAQMARWDLIRPPSINYSSTNSLFAIGVVMSTVLISAIYPALRAGRSANPGVQRSWKMPKPEGDELKLTFPFTVSAYDITGVISYLAEHFQAHDDAGLGSFAARNVSIHRAGEDGNLTLSAELALAPFDLGVTQTLELTAVPSEIPGVDEVSIRAVRLSGARGDWTRGNRSFLKDLRHQFLIWRTLSADAIESYRMRTLQALKQQETTHTEVEV